MRISDEEFEHEVEAAIDSLPDRFKRAAGQWSVSRSPTSRTSVSGDDAAPVR